jgi:hypothetical protein
MRYYCCDEKRRLKLEGMPGLNGFDYIEVSEDQVTLLVYFVNEIAPGVLDRGNFAVEGGERIRSISITAVRKPEHDEVSAPEAIPYCLALGVSSPGDFSHYVLQLRDASDNTAVPAGFDPILSSVQFSFKVRCPSNFDCRAKKVCCPTPARSPEIDYLAKGYASFRQVMLDRLAVLMPDWKERNPADVGVALVELMAYVGDRLSYQQDAIATEAYLGTARHRTSVRRHARLVDYAMHDGCNARVWVRVITDTNADGKLLPGPDPTQDRAGTVLLTQTSAASGPVPTTQLGVVLSEGPIVFETMHDIILHAAHDELLFHTWGDTRCCLPQGATAAALSGSCPNLKVGDVLILAEVKGPRTGIAGDADLTKRHPVRLTRVHYCRDEVYGVDVTEIQWGTEDALPFPLCVSRVKDNGDVEDVSVAWGNIVLADHGLTVPVGKDEHGTPNREELGTVPVAEARRNPQETYDFCALGKPDMFVPEFRPRLGQGPVTFSRPVQTDEPAALATCTGVETAMPAVAVKQKAAPADNIPWRPVRHLLDSQRDDKVFVVETEDGGTAGLRFGDGDHGAQPEPGSSFTTRYRVGNGQRGNVGRGAIRHVVCDGVAAIQVDNPLPATGGTDPESTAAVRQAAPIAFRTQQRAVTPQDYEEVAMRHAEVQRARATFRWTGSWHTVFLTIDRKNGLPVDSEFEQEIRDHMERFRLAGYDLEVDAPLFAPLEVELAVCVKPDHFCGDVEQVLLRVLGGGVRPCGRLGFFHPDNLTFGQTVYLSRVLAAAQAVPGVASVRPLTFRRWGTHDTEALDRERIELGRLEIARLDNDPSYPEHGVLRLKMEGGK